MIVEKVSGSQIVDIDKRKYLVPSDITVAQFMWIIRKRIQLPSEKAIFLFVDKTVPQSRWAQRYTEILNTCTVLCGTPPPCHYCLFTLCFFNRPQISNIKPAIKHTCLVLWVTYCEALAFLTWYAEVRLSHMCVYLSISVRVSSSYVGNQSPCEGEATPELSIYTDLIIFFCLFTLIDVLMKNLTCFLQLCVGSVHL